MIHPLVVIIICAKYEKNPPRTVCPVKWTQQYGPYFSSFIAKLRLNELEDRSNIILHDTSSDTSDHFCLIWKKSNEISRRCTCIRQEGS